MDSLYYTLVADGSSDRLLLRHLSWLLRQHVSDRIAAQPQGADLRSLRQKPFTLAERVQAAVDLYPCDLLFVHRDAEHQPPERRLEEIRQAVSGLRHDSPVICVVPVRMTEAWLLFHEQAIRRAAGNPRGGEPLGIPQSNFEDIADPKVLLRQAIRDASGLSGRRLKRFDIAGAVHRVAEFIDDFSPLLRLPAFRRLDDDVRSAVNTRGWGLAQAKR